jgi:hypothetical protein
LSTTVTGSFWKVWLFRLKEEGRRKKEEGRRNFVF